MKKLYLLFISAIVFFSIISCDTITSYKLNVTLDRQPVLTIINQTGHTVTLTAPLSSSINNGARTQLQPADANRFIEVTYRIGQIQFSEQVTMNNTDATITLTKRPPTVTVVNQTGREITISTPISDSLNNGENRSFLPPVLNQNFNITYSSGRMQLTEQVNMREQDVTVNLTVGAPALTIVNSTGTGNNINIIQFRSPGSIAWIGGNIAIRNNELYLTEGTAQTGVTTQVLANGDRLSLWLGSLNLSGNAFDIRLQTPSGSIFQKDNVRITRDTILTFTQSDRR